MIIIIIIETISPAYATPFPQLDAAAKATFADRAAAINAKAAAEWTGR
jgi:hypothetical protein